MLDNSQARSYLQVGQVSPGLPVFLKLQHFSSSNFFYFEKWRYRTNKMVPRAYQKKHWKASFEKTQLFCVGEYAEYGFDQQRLIW